MAYIEGYKYDIFISYSHIDNEENPRRKGWVAKFYEELNLLLKRSLGSREISFWWDTSRLDGSIVFDDAIADAIKNSAILICLNSPSFLNSEYCQKELKLFYQHAEQSQSGLRLNDRCRILNLLLFNIPYTKWPEEFRGTTGFIFNNAEQEDDQGDTIDIRTGKFKKALQNLRDAIVALVKEFEQTSLKPVPETAFTIYFGDVSDTLNPHRDRIIGQLQKKGYKIEYDIPPPYESLPHEKAVIGKLSTSHLNVHLLDNIKGRKVVGEELMWYPQKQLELSMKVDKPKLIWIPEEVNISKVEEEKYRNFLLELEAGEFSGETSYIRGKKSRLLKEITDLAEMLKLQEKQVAPPKLSVLLDTHYIDQLSVLDLYKNLVEEKVQPILNPQEGDPLKNIQSLEERITQVKNLVFYFGEVSEQWIKERFIAARQYITSTKLQAKDFLLFLMPPSKDPDLIARQFGISEADIFDNSSSAHLQSGTFRQLLERIKR